MLKKIVLAVVILGLVLGFSSLALAEEKVEFKELRLTAVREEPVNFLGYARAQLDFWRRIIDRLLETGKPSALFDEQEAFGVEATVLEDMFKKPLDGVAGFTFKDEERGKFYAGLEYTGLKKFSGGIWDIFQNLRPGLYLIEGDLRWGFSYELKFE